MKGFRLLSYLSKEGVPRAGLLVERQVFDLERVLGETGYDRAHHFSSVKSTLERWQSVRPEIDSLVAEILAGDNQGLLSFAQPLAKIRLLAPVLYPGALYCAGANYRDHILEMSGMPPPEILEDPFFFLKTVKGTIIGPGEAIRLPAFSSMVDWEAEIALVIGRAGKNIPLDRAMDYVAGFTIMNDLSARDLSKRQDVPFLFDWIGQKCFDTAAPMGPWITPTEAVLEPNNMTIKLWVNNILKQDSNSNQMIFRFEEQISYLSRHVTLYPGDVISTGTPAGCGMPKGEFLKPGDHIRINVSELGDLWNPVS